MFRTNKKSLWEVGIGYMEKDGTCIDNDNVRKVVATSAEEAIAKCKIKLPKYLVGVKRVSDIDVA